MNKKYLLVTFTRNIARNCIVGLAPGLTYIVASFGRAIELKFLFLETINAL